MKEAGLVLSLMKNNKSPGSSGFTAEFFKLFGIILWGRKIIVFEITELSSTQTEGLITCIPKGGKCKKYIKNLSLYHCFIYPTQLHPAV